MQVQLNRVVHDILKHAVKANRIDPIIVMATFPCRQLINSSFPLISKHCNFTVEISGQKILPDIVNGAICRLQSELDKANDACQFLTVDESSFIMAPQQSVWKYGTPATPLQPAKLILRSKQADMTLLNNQLTVA
ncbi:hypothetical protein Tsp_00397 [Trichinella spiralis]|uniref:hypothetical protein n=1 Tax=Trichinella spiralis TaxID=6334 RepID=UPI0001EFB299|nr:hypothetical protein Tsp_00397 [Trichinella spiralis]